ncbi:hypothetical protein EMGBD3_15750 [Nitrosarchaeum sp.]|nr:hypothetical protein EMGBD3_15750 [Nitrosarchaeum sp.]
MTEQDNKIFVRIDRGTVTQLIKLANPNEISPNLVTKVIEHCHTCDKWKLEQDEEKNA